MNPHDDDNAILAPLAFTYNLLYPITTDDGRTIEQVSFKRRLTGAMMRDASRKFKVPEERELYFMSFSMMLKLDDVDLMDSVDLNKMQGIFANFLHHKKSCG